VPHIALPNLVADRRILPELVQGEFTAGAVAATVGRWLDDPREAREVRAGLADLRARLSGDGAFERAGDFSGGLAPVTLEGGRCGYIDPTGKLAIPARFRECNPFSAEGLARVDLAADAFDGDRVAFIDRAGKPVVIGPEASPPFDSAEDFENGLAAVGAGGAPYLAGGGTWLGYIDTAGRYVWKPSR